MSRQILSGRYWSRILIILVFAFSSLFYGLQKSRSQSQISQVSCPIINAQDWQKFLKQAADNEKWVETCEDSTCDKIFFNHVTKRVKAVLDACEPQIEADAKIASCTANMQKFVPAWLHQHDSTSYGFNVDNATYLAEQEAPDKPAGMMKIPEAIVNALPDQKRVQEVARENGWKYLTHDSALQGVRTFILVQDPGQRFDQWMLLNLRGPGEKNISKDMPVSIVAVQKKTAGGQPLDQVRLHFRDYAIESNGSQVKLSVNELGNGKCFSCHASGMRQLIPRITNVLEAKPVWGEAFYNQETPSDFAYRRLVAFNKIIRRYGNNDWDGKIVPEEHGPKLGQKQGCISCHDGESRGALYVSTSTSQLTRKILTELSMPPSHNWIRLLERSEMKNPSLSSKDEKNLKMAVHYSQALNSEFMSSRFADLKKWLLESSCL